MTICQGRSGVLKVPDKSAAQSRGISLVAVSHSQELLEKICSRILHLSAISG